MNRALALLSLSWTLSLLAASECIAQNVQVNTPDHNTATQGNFTTQSETSHAAFGSTIVVGFNNSKQFATSLEDWSSVVGYAYSTNGGLTFTDAGLILPPSGRYLLGDPAVVADKAGNFYLASLAGTVGPNQDCTRSVDDPDCPLNTYRLRDIALFTSTSTSVAFGAPVFIPGTIIPSATGETSFPDKELIAVDGSGGPFNGRVYVAWCELFLIGGCERTLFTRSTSTSPLAFKAPVALNAPDMAYHSGAMPAVGPNGEVYVVWGRWTLGSTDPSNPYTSQTVQLLKSADGGDTFSNPDLTDPHPSKTVAAPTMTVPNLGMRTLGFPYIAVDETGVDSPTRGNIYVVFQADPDGPGPDRSDVFFTRSTDGGAHWSLPRSISSGPAVTINPDPTANDNWQPSIAVSGSTGQITVSFYDRRDDPANTAIRLYAAVSTDGGTTWFNKVVSDAQFLPYTPPYSGGYMGDYNWVAAHEGAIDFTWGDTRNKVVQPVGAMNPASPPGRPDQDVFFATANELSGPDLYITPWGNITGIGSLWQSPDIFVVDATGAKVNASKGLINRLRARVKNLGTVAASGAIVRFKFAPLVAGTPNSVFEEIGTIAADFAPGETKELSIDWDLTNLTDINGGIWPMPVSAYDHFCVKVFIELTGDVNMANNIAQNNFSDVQTVTGPQPFRFLIGNPYDTEEEARLILGPLPEGFAVTLRGAPAPFGRGFRLKGREIKTVNAVLTRRLELAKHLPTGDVVAQVSLQIRGKLVGGFSLRLAARPTAGKRAFAGDPDRVFDAIRAVLKEKGESLAVADRSRGLINTNWIPLKPSQLRGGVQPDLQRQMARRSGRILLSFRLRKVGEGRTEVTVSSMIIVDLDAGNMLGGLPVGSSGQIEREHLDQIAKRLSASEQ